MDEILFTRQATRDLLETAEYLLEKSQDIEIVHRYLDQLQEYIVETLQDFPHAGRPAEEFGPGIRKLVYQHFSILYKSLPGKIAILTIYREKLPRL